MKYRCEFCERETRNSLISFPDINWIAFKIGKDKVLCACYEHHQKLVDLIISRL
jgi:hypothetical protein